MLKTIRIYSFVWFGWIGILSSIVGMTACSKTASLPASSALNTIKIGEVETLTGAEATYGVGIHRGILLAVEQINARGGLHGKKIEVITLDDQGKPEESAIAATQLITQYKVQALIGAVTSSRSLAMGPIAERHKIPMITPTATNPKVTQMGQNIFRTCFIDAFQGKVMAKFAIAHLKVKTAAILRDVKSDYSVGLSDVFKTVFQEMGGKIISEQSFNSGDIDFKAQLTAIRAKSPQVIFIPAYYSDAGLIIRQIRELGIEVPLLGTDGWDSPKLVEVAGKAANNGYFSNHYSKENQSVIVQEFISKFLKAFGTEPDGIAALGYDTAGLLIDAIQRAQLIAPKEIREAIGMTKNYVGVTGMITMDQDRNPIKSAVILKLDAGKVIYQNVVNP
jgi:branched-chain amino acid transport system substrate-binding protein